MPLLVKNIIMFRKKNTHCETSRDESFLNKNKLFLFFKKTDVIKKLRNLFSIILYIIY